MAKQQLGTTGKLTIENQQVEAVYEELPLEEVKLDPDNPRIREQLRQARINGKAKPEELRKLILEISGVPNLLRSIRENKGLHDPIYVRQDGRVAEGNCRTAIYQFLREAKPKEKCWQTIPAWRLPATVTERQIAVLQGHWHVAGKITWRAHEQAGHLHHMHHVLGMQVSEIAAAMRMQEPEVERYLQAYETMTKMVIPRIKNADGREKFSYVLELYKNRKLKTFRAKKENVKLFADLVVGDKLSRGAQVRGLHRIIGDDRATEVLKKDGYEKAIHLVGKSDPTADSVVFRKLKAATSALERLRRPLLERIKSGQKEKQLLQGLYTALKNVAATTGVTLK
jgi:hypothetical protein